MGKIKYLFVDFDNTIRETIANPTESNPNDRRPPFKVEEVKIISGVADKLKEWQEKEWLIVGVSNQSGVEKGLVTEEEVEMIAAETMNQLDIYFPFYFAKYKRTGTPMQLRMRKPDTGMAILAFSDWGEPDFDNSFMVGDYKSDVGFAENLGIKYVDVKDFLKNY